MPNGYRNINYLKMLYESMRNYFSVNSSGKLSLLYKYCAAHLQVLQAPFNNYETFRNTQFLIAQCKWQIGQLTNVMNMLFDPTLKRIFITQSVSIIIADPGFAYPAVNFDNKFTVAPVIFEPGFNDPISRTVVTFNVPVSINIPSIKAVIEQIRILGIPYRIQTF
jgi:hypothetical protein